MSDENAPRRSRARDLLRRLLREHTAPHRLAAAVAVGVVVGCSPFFGLHFWIGLGLALLFRLNKVAVFLGSQISIPPLAPVLGFASVQVGSLLLTGDVVLLTLDDFSISNLPALLRQFLLAWLVGGFVLGFVLGLPAYCLTVVIVRRRRADPKGDEWSAELRRAAERFCGARPGHRHYAALKYRMDPIYRQACEILGQRQRVVDLGTGLGMLPVLLAQRGQVERVIGIDWDEAKISTGTTASADLPAVELIQADIREHGLGQGEVDAVVLIDVLHYWPLDQQTRILSAAADALRSGGRLLVRETDRQARSLLTRALEAIAVATRWNRGPGLTYRTEAELSQELVALGLSCGAGAASSSSVHRGNVLIWADRD